MGTETGPYLQRLQRLERELVIWRAVGLAAVAMICFGFAQSGAQREARFVSADGRQSVVISGQGITFFDKDKTLGRLGFEGVGDGDDIEVNLNVTGQLTTYEVNVHSGDNRLFLSADRVGFAQKGAVRASLRPDGLFLQDKSGRAKIDLVTPEQGLAGLDFIDQGKLILSLGSVGKTGGGNPPRRDAGAIHIADFGHDFKSRLITASEALPPATP
jgi:hypothetical protein